MAKPSITASPLISAVRAQNLEGVIKALQEGAAVNEPDAHGYPDLPLRAACFEGNPAIINTLIHHGADINAPGSDGPGMPLRIAVRTRQRPILELLLQLGAEIPAGIDTDFETSTAPAPSLPPSLEKPAIRKPAAEPAHCPVIEVMELEACYGLDTNILTEDMLRLSAESSPATPSRRNRPDR